MKINRNDSCPCGNGKKYKNCCGKKTFQKGDVRNIYRWLILGSLGVFFAIFLWGVIEFFNTDHPEMEAYKCDNPSCGKIHYRQKVDSN